MNSAPAFIHFPAKGKRKSADAYEIQRIGFQADSIAKWVAERTEIKVSLIQQNNVLSPFCDFSLLRCDVVQRICILQHDFDL